MAGAAPEGLKISSPPRPMRLISLCLRELPSARSLAGFRMYYYGGMEEDCFEHSSQAAAGVASKSFASPEFRVQTPGYGSGTGCKTRRAQPRIVFASHSYNVPVGRVPSEESNPV